MVEKIVMVIDRLDEREVFGGREGGRGVEGIDCGFWSLYVCVMSNVDCCFAVNCW